MENQIIQTYLKRNSSSKSITRGKAILKEDDVIVQRINYEEDTASFYVRSQASSLKYEVQITDFDDPKHIEAECDCPVQDEVCKHCVASLLYLERDMEENSMISSIESKKTPISFIRKIPPHTQAKEEIAAELKKKLDEENERKKNILYPFRMGNLSVWAIDATWNSKIRVEGELLVRLNNVGLTPNKDKSVNAIVKDTFTGQTIEYEVYIEKTGQGQ